MTAKARGRSHWLARVTRFAALACCIAVLAMPISASLRAMEPDRLSQMFEWWNAALKHANGFTVESFSRYWDDDASLVINGKESTRGIAALTEHFKQIQARGGEIEIVVPFLEVFQSGDRIFTHHIIRTRRDGKVGCMLVSGWARMKNNKILALDLVRVELDPATSPPEFKCWQQ
jgi:hypothetical protein